MANTVTKRIGSVTYYWNSDEGVLKKQISPMKALLVVAVDIDVYEVDDAIARDVALSS